MTDLTKFLLGDALTQTERLYLESMSHHDGFPVLKKMFDQVIDIVTKDIVKVKPLSPTYSREVEVCHLRANNINEAFEAIRKSFIANVMIANELEEKEKANERNNSTAAAN